MCIFRNGYYFNPLIAFWIRITIQVPGIQLAIGSLCPNHVGVGFNYLLKFNWAIKQLPCCKSACCLKIHNANSNGKTYECAYNRRKKGSCKEGCKVCQAFVLYSEKYTQNQAKTKANGPTCVLRCDVCNIQPKNPNPVNNPILYPKTSPMTAPSIAQKIKLTVEEKIFVSFFI